MNPPVESLSEWGVRSIDRLNKKEKIEVSTPAAFAAKRLIVIAIPIFASLDAVCFFSRSLLNVPRFKWMESKSNLSKGCQSVKLVFSSIVMMPAGLILPDWSYKTNEAWMEIMLNQCEKRFRDQMGSCEGKAKIKEDMTQFLEDHLSCRVSKNAICIVVEAAVREIPWGKEMEQLVIDEYVQLFSQLIVTLAHSPLPKQITEENQIWKEILPAVVKVRKPPLRKTLWANALLQMQKNFETKLDMSKLNDGNQTLAAFLFFQLNMLQDRVQPFLKEQLFFKDNHQSLLLISALIDLIGHQKLTTNQKLKTAEKLLACFQREIKGNDLKKRRNEIRKKINQLVKPKGRKGKLSKALDKHEKRIDYLKNKTSKTEKEQKELEQLPKKIEGLKKQLNKFPDENPHSNELAELQAELMKLPVIEEKKHPYESTLLGINQLRVFLAFKDESYLLTVIEQNQELDAEDILSPIYGAMIGREMEKKEIDTLNKLSRPDLVIHYHSRLKELPAKEREAAMTLFRQFVEAILNGTLDAVRHDEDTNPHLKTIFNLRTDIKDKWNVETKKVVKDLIEKPARKYRDAYVVDTFEPCDLLQQSSSFANSCLDMNGLLYKIKGLLGYMFDGKTHTILLKDCKGNAMGHTRLQLMFDGKNNCPVLYQDDIHLPTTDNKDQTAQNALRAFCQQKAKELGLPLVTDWEITFSNFDGTVESLGSSAPFDYVNSLRKTTDGTYRLGSMTVVS